MDHEPLGPEAIGGVGSQDPIPNTASQQAFDRILANGSQFMAEASQPSLPVAWPASAGPDDGVPDSQAQAQAQPAGELNAGLPPVAPFDPAVPLGGPLPAGMGLPAIPGLMTQVPLLYTDLAPIHMDPLVHPDLQIGRDSLREALKHPSLLKPEHEDSRAKRRGPMDEMRQLVRIMVKLFPQSVKYLSANDEPGGGNRVTEPQIKNYLKNTLGDEAPQPKWGMPEGWGAYLSDLFTWALGREVTDEEARSCACRQQGRSWQINEHRLAELGMFTYAWPLPLTIEGVTKAQADPGDPPPGTPFVGPPSGWPDVELPYWQSKKAKQSIIPQVHGITIRAPVVNLVQPSKDDIEQASEKAILDAVSWQIMAAARKSQASRGNMLPNAAASVELYRMWDKLRDTCAKMVQVHMANVGGSGKDLLLSNPSFTVGMGSDPMMYGASGPLNSATVRGRMYANMDLSGTGLTTGSGSPHPLLGSQTGMLLPGMLPHDFAGGMLLPANGVVGGGSQQHFEALMHAVKHAQGEVTTTDNTDGSPSAAGAASVEQDVGRGQRKRQRASGSEAADGDTKRSALQSEVAEVESGRVPQRARAQRSGKSAQRAPSRQTGADQIAGLSTPEVHAADMSRDQPAVQVPMDVTDGLGTSIATDAGSCKKENGSAGTHMANGSVSAPLATGPVSNAQALRQGLFAAIEGAGDGLPAGDSAQLSTTLPPIAPLAATGIDASHMHKPAAGRSMTSPRKART